MKENCLFIYEIFQSVYKITIFKSHVYVDTNSII